MSIWKNCYRLIWTTKLRTLLILVTILWILNFQFFSSLFNSNGTPFEVLYEIVVYYVIILFLTTLFSFSKILNILVYNFLFIISIVGVYFINTMGIVVDGTMLNNVLSTDSAEAIELLNSTFYIYLLLSLIGLYFINKYFLFKQERMNLKDYGVTIVIVLLIAFGLFKTDRDSLDKFMATDTPSVAPLFLIPSIGEYVNSRDRLVEINKKNISSEYELVNDTNDTIVVFILGESARGDKFGLNGYTKNTTPNLAKNGNVISFKDATSCHTSTLNSVPCLMTRVEQKNYDITIDETSFVEIYKDLGFKTYWYSRHSNQKRVNTFCEEAEVCEYLKDTKYDMALVEKLETLENLEQNTLVVLHTLGSHFDYNERVPEAYKLFKPLCYGNVSGCDKESLNNSYDNTIHYTDVVIAALIEKLKDKNACIVFTSDHGESLGEDSLGLVERYGHSTPYAIAPKEQKDVPFILWFSDRYLQKHPSVNVSSIRAKKGVNHDNVFSTVLSCGGITPKYEEEKLNLLNR